MPPPICAGNSGQDALGHVQRGQRRGVAKSGPEPREAVAAGGTGSLPGRGPVGSVGGVIRNSGCVWDAPGRGVRPAMGRPGPRRKSSRFDSSEIHPRVIRNRLLKRTPIASKLTYVARDSRQHGMQIPLGCGQTILGIRTIESGRGYAYELVAQPILVAVIRVGRVITGVTKGYCRARRHPHWFSGSVVPGTSRGEAHFPVCPDGRTRGATGLRKTSFGAGRLLRRLSGHMSQVKVRWRAVNLPVLVIARSHVATPAKPGTRWA